MHLTHGGDWAGYEAEYGKQPLDFSANVSPLGLPQGVRKAILAALDTADRYPDPLCRKLCEKLSVFHQIPQAQILCGNGAADLIFRLVLAKQPKTALLTAPTFAEYEQALSIGNCKVQHSLLSKENNFSVTKEILSAITPSLDLLFLCEPNNPTGRTTDFTLLQEILRKCQSCGTMLVVDECFNDFLETPSAHTLQSALCTHPNLLILKAFTKCYAMAGVRLGYVLCSDAKVLQQMRACGQPWSVSSLAVAAGCAALCETEYLSELHHLIQTQRPCLQEGLVEIGCMVYPGEANFLLFYCKDEMLAQKLREKSVLIRSCANYVGLGSGWYRVAVRTKKENEALLCAMREVL